MKNGVQSCRVVAYMLLIVITLPICLVSIMGCVEKSQRPPLQDDLVDNQDKAVEFLESYEWIIQQVEATEDFVLPALLIPSIDQEETFYLGGGDFPWPEPDPNPEQQPKAPANAPTEGTDYFLYTVRAGDTLWSISRERMGTGTRYKEIMALNGLLSENIRAGQVLKVPE